MTGRTLKFADGRNFRLLRAKVARIAGICGILFSFLIFLMAWPCSAQTQTAVIRGQVTDPSGAALVSATVLLTTPSGASTDTATNKEGVYEFKNLAAGTYEIKAVAAGFAMFDKKGIVLAADQALQLDVPLTLEIEKEKVEVNESATQVDVSPQNNANSIVLQGKDLEALSDDPDELSSELQALAGPSAGPNGGQIYIDGFTAGQLPPKASIREIRINQNPFSSEYDKLGYGRVEIFTKPGTDKLHGQLQVQGNTSSFNSRNPFETAQDGVSPPGYDSEQYSGNVGGPINKKASFFFNIERRNIGALNVVSAQVLDPANNFAIVPESLAVANPQTRTNLSPRIDYQLTPNNTLTVRYQYFRDVVANAGVGQFNLPETGSDTLGVEHTFQATDTQIIGAHAINESRFQFVHTDNENTPLQTGTTLDVGGAFRGNGSGGFGSSDIQKRYEYQNTTFLNYGKHAWKFGGRIRATNDRNQISSNFNGTFSFGSRANPDPTCIPAPANNDCIITPIVAYQITEQGIAAGLPFATIQAMGGGASYFTQTFQTAGGAQIIPSTVTWVDAGLFIQDDWKVRPNITLSYGLRFETQNNFSDKSDFAPRLGLAWGIGGNAKNPPKTVLRAGFGMFYDRFSYDLIETQQRFNLLNPLQQQLQIQNPAFFLPVPSPVPAGTLVSTLYQANNNLRAPYTIQTGVTLERQLTKSANAAVTYLNSRGVHQFYTNNLNPFLPATDGSSGGRPFPAQGNVFQYQSEGTFKQNQLIVNGSVRIGAKLSLFGYYTYNHADSDTSGASSFPSNPLNLQEDYGRASFDIRHRLFLGGTIGLPRGFRLSPFVMASSGIPFNITTGTDPFQDNLYNVRPAFAACTAANQTQFGCFDANPTPNAAPIPVYYGEGPGRFSMNLRVSKTFGFGPAIEGASGGGGGGGMSGGTFGRGPGGGPRGGGGGRGGDAGSTNRRYSLTVSVIGRNIFNNVNLATPIGNLGSPLFGESNGLAGRPYSDSTSNRRLDLQLTFTF
ncbi:MAG TPA: carboxypeptidase regulatory-like domain-containing protein [Candidatus Limnocylindrales bacterium]|nr:carboxypeptidase regulatory-like domain-containing protein [Candidatus Limnocylindrales bacterium]